jgi:hypothetical protein
MASCMQEIIGVKIIRFVALSIEDEVNYFEHIYV